MRWEIRTLEEPFDLPDGGELGTDAVPVVRVCFTIVAANIFLADNYVCAYCRRADKDGLRHHEHMVHHKIPGT